MISPLPSEDAWDAYNKSYFINAHGGLNSSKWIEAYNIGVAKTRLNAFLKYLDEQNLEISSVLEIGPGQGYLMREFKKRLPNLDYYVVESDSSVHDGLKRQGAAIIDATDVKTIKPVDAVIATHVLEHTLDPIAFLRHFTSACALVALFLLKHPASITNIKTCMNRMFYSLKNLLSADVLRCAVYSISH